MFFEHSHSVCKDPPQSLVRIAKQRNSPLIVTGQDRVLAEAGELVCGNLTTLRLMCSCVCDDLIRCCIVSSNLYCLSYFCGSIWSIRRGGNVINYLPTTVHQSRLSECQVRMCNSGPVMPMRLFGGWDIYRRHMFGETPADDLLSSSP